MPSVVNSWRVEYKINGAWHEGQWLNTPERADDELSDLLTNRPNVTDWIIVQKVVETRLRPWKGKGR